MNGTELRSFSDFQILTWIGYSDLSRNLENWLIFMFAFIPCETVKLSQDEQIRISTCFRSLFLMNGIELRSFSHFQILTKIAYHYLRRKLENWLFWSFSSSTVKLWKSVKMIKFKCKLDLEVVSWWMVQN